MNTLQNDKVRVSFDKTGKLQELINLQTGHNYAGGHPVWRLNFQRGKTFDCEVNAETPPVISTSDNKIILDYGECLYDASPINFRVKITICLANDEVKWAVEISNNEPECNIRELHFPLIHAISIPEEQALIYPFLGGQICQNIKHTIKSRHSLWKGKDHIFTEYKHAYPRQAATNCFTFANADCGLYFGLHNPQNEETEHSFRMYADKLSISMGRYPCCECGQTWSLDGYVVSPYNGSWHVPANKYRAWLDSPECDWFELHKIPEWVRKMHGWQRVIMKHQYGEIHYKYAQMPEMREDGQKSGIDTLFMFGWQNGGHDNNYPDYTPDPELGTEKQLKAGIKDFTQHNGQVILYANGQLIDLNSEFYKKHGSDVTIKDFHGNSRRDAYHFSSTGHFYGKVANRSFEHGCPYSELWEKELEKVVDTAAAYGCQSAFFDQLGRASFPCCDPNHGHPVPAFGIGAQRGRQIKRLRKRARTHSSEMALGVEIITDVTACQADYVHSLSGFCKAMNDWEHTGDKPEHEYFIDWFRYIFPEIIISDREIRDDSDIERRVNHAVLKGLRHDIEIYRCRKTIAETPHYQEYLGKITHLRKKYSYLLLEGMYRDTENFVIDNDQIEARSFVNGDKLAVVLTQSHLAVATTNLSVPGYTYVDADGVNKIEVIRKEGFCHVELKKHGLAIVIYEKEK
jgi:Domain of unknown function (DUF6259)